jgi:hypothetical protein
MIYASLTTLAFWLLRGLDTAQALSLPAYGRSYVVEAMASKFGLSLSLNSPTKAIWDAPTFSAGAFLGLAAIFAVHYARSPWRKLPPSPRGLPIIGNALQANNMIWLISKDCKERFGEYHIIYLLEC